MKKKVNFLYCIHCWNFFAQILVLMSVYLFLFFFFKHCFAVLLITLGQTMQCLLWWTLIKKLEVLQVQKESTIVFQDKTIQRRKKEGRERYVRTSSNSAMETGTELFPFTFKFNFPNNNRFKQSACYYTFFTVWSVESVIASQLVSLRAIQVYIIALAVQQVFYGDSIIANDYYYNGTYW